MLCGVVHRATTAATTEGIMAENIMNASQRNKLPPKYEPYWRKIGAGHLGFRKRETDLIGAWVAKWKTGEMLPKSNRCLSRRS